MQEIINKYLSSMLNKLLEKALKEKPKIRNCADIEDYRWDELFLHRTRYLKYEISIVLPFKLANAYFEKDKRLLIYTQNLTDKQKEMVNKIYKKWGNNARTN